MEDNTKFDLISARFEKKRAVGLVLKLFENCVFRNPSAFEQFNRLCGTNITHSAVASHEAIRAVHNLFCKLWCTTDHIPLNSESAGQVHDTIHYEASHNVN